MKRLLILVVVLLLAAAPVLKAQTLTFTLLNGVNIAGPKYQFEVWIKSSNGTSRMGSTLVYVNYSTAGFGPSVAASVGLTKGSSFGASYSVNSVNNNTTSRIAFGWTFPSGAPGTGNIIPSTGDGVLAFTVQIPISNTNQTSGLSFENGLMTNQQFLDDETSKWSIVTTSTLDGPLPIQLTGFRATELSGSSVRLTWQTASEIDNYGFEVQRSADQLTGFQSLPGSFQAGHGTTLEAHEYTWTDPKANASEPWYRLKQTDLDQTVHYYEALQVSGVMSVPETAPLEFQLLQNYPNPFNPVTQIAFSVKQTGPASLKLYSTLGQEVATLFEGLAEAGQYYRVTLDGRRLASGVYLYRLVSADQRDVKRLVLMK